MQERGDWLRVMPIPSNLPIETLFAHVEGVAFDVSGEDRATSGKGSSSGAPATQHAASPSVGDHLESVRQWTLEAVAEFANCPVALPGKGASAGDSQGGNKNPGEERAGVATVMWALRRTGDMLYLVSGCSSRSQGSPVHACSTNRWRPLEIRSVPCVFRNFHCVPRWTTRTVCWRSGLVAKRTDHSSFEAPRLVLNLESCAVYSIGNEAFSITALGAGRRGLIPPRHPP